MTLEHYNQVTDYARRNSPMGGWDYFLETIGLDDFIQVCEDRGLDTYEKALRHWGRWCRFHSDMHGDVRAEAF